MPTFPLSFPILFEGTVTPWKTAGHIVNRTALRVGLRQEDDPFESRDKNMIQLCALLEEIGQDLWDERPWSHLLRVGELTTTTGDSAYPLPDGFGFLANNTAWDRTSRLPLGGPITAAAWQAEKGSLATPFSLQLRLWQQQLQFFPDTDTPGDRDIAFEFGSRYWVQRPGQDSPDTDEVTASADIIWYDPRLCIAKLRLTWLEAKGLPSEAAERDYLRRLGKTSANDSPGGIVVLGGRQCGLPSPHTADTWDQG
jgi:hypothetical protein